MYLSYLSNLQAVIVGIIRVNRQQYYEFVGFYLVKNDRFCVRILENTFYVIIYYCVGTYLGN